MRFVLLFILMAFGSNCFSQYQFKGQVAQNVEGKTVYLSVIEDYRKLSRISTDHIIKKIVTQKSYTPNYPKSLHFD